MFLIRSAEPRDFKEVVALARILDSYNLPCDRRFVRELLRDSKSSFQGRPLPAERRRFLLVAEDVGKHKVVGCSLIISRHGTHKLPHIAFHVSQEWKRSRTIRRSVAHRTLTLTVNREGFTEIGGLVVIPRYRRRREHLGKQLSRARFAYMVWHPRRFQSRLLVEFLPTVDRLKGNKFWDVLGARFTRLSYREADRLSVQGKEFILSLFPKEKVYCGLLPKSAIRELGICGKGAQASLRTLEKIGFRYLNQVDPFDGGPHYGALRRNISVVRETRFFRYRDATRAGADWRTRRYLLRSGKPAFVMTVKEGTVRGAVSQCWIRKGEVSLSADVAAALKLRDGDRVSLTPV